MDRNFDVIVVGAGSMGMAAGYYLSRKGLNILMIDAFDPPHEKGSHSGDTRLIRHACGEGMEYVPLALRAQELWNALQSRTTETIFRRTGVLTFAPPHSEFIQTAIEGGHEYNLDIEKLSADEMNERWPGMSIPDNQIGCYEPLSGVLFSGNCIRTFKRLALWNGAELKVNSPVLDIDIEDDYVIVKTEENEYTADKLVISGGAWNKKLLNEIGLNINVQASRRTIAWFDADESLYQSDDYPGFFADLDEGIYYGFPSIDGTGLKLGRYDNGDDIDPAYINREFGIYEKDERDLRYFLSQFMPQANSGMNAGKTCMFTNTPDENFVIDLHPEHPHVALAAGFSGHGYKFSSAVGEVLSELITEGKAGMDISLFSTERECLQPRLDDRSRMQ